MKLASDVTREMLLGVVEKTLQDLESEQRLAEKAYQDDNTNEFQHSMATAFKCASDMIRSRIETLQE